jgi:hypothetical protein
VDSVDALIIDKSLKNDKRIGPTKTGKNRIAFLHPVVLNLLREWKEDTPNKTIMT